MKHQFLMEKKDGATLYDVVNQYLLTKQTIMESIGIETFDPIEELVNVCEQAMNMISAMDSIHMD